MSENEIGQGESILATLKKEKLGRDKGIMVCPADSVFKTITSDGKHIVGELEVNALCDTFGIKEDDADSLARRLLIDGNYSLRSRLQQSGFSVESSSVEDGRLGVTLTNLTGKDIVNIPESFSLLRFFVENPELRVKGDKLKSVALNIFPEGNEANLNYWFDNEKTAVAFKWGSEAVSVPMASTIDLKAVVDSNDREALHRILKLQSGDIDIIAREGFYLARSAKVSVPKEYCLRIVTSPSRENWSEGHLASPIIDPGFNGSIMFEHIRSGTEEGAGEKRNMILSYVYKV
jgi:hypothetical protein